MKHNYYYLPSPDKLLALKYNKIDNDLTPCKI